MLSSDRRRGYIEPYIIQRNMITTKMFIKSASYFYPKSSNWVLNLFNGLVLMLLNKFVLNSIIRRCSSGINYFNYYAKFAFYVNEIGANKVHKGVCTKMHTCLVGNLYICSLIRLRKLGYRFDNFLCRVLKTLITK